MATLPQPLPAGNTSWMQPNGLPSTIFLQYMTGLDRSANAGAAAGITAASLRGYIAGYQMWTNGGSSLFVGSGTCVDSTYTSFISVPSLSKGLGAWVAGSGGGLDTGTATSNTWYYVYAILNTTTLATDLLLSLSPSAPTLPSGFTLFRCIGVVRSSGTTTFVAFKQFGSFYQYNTPFGDVNLSASFGTTQTAFTLTVPPNAPVGSVGNGRVIAYIRASFVNASSTALGVLSSTDESGTTVGNAPIGNRNLQANVAGVASSTSLELLAVGSQINGVCNVASCTLQIATYGFWWERGADA